MGASKSGGYAKNESVTPELKTLLDQFIKTSEGNTAQAAQGFAQFLPGGGGGEAIKQQANQNFQQNTIPAILNATGQGNKGSSALNQALASGASNLNTDINSQLAQMQLQASQGLAGLGINQGQLGSKDQFAYMQKQMPFWQQATLGGIGALGTAFSGKK